MAAAPAGRTYMSDVVSTGELLQVLLRAEEPDPLGQKIAKALDLIERVMDDLGEEAIAISFNGGKDCTVLLHLYAAVLFKRHSSIAAEKLDGGVTGLPHGTSNRPTGGENGTSSASQSISGLDRATDDEPAAPTPVPAHGNASTPSVPIEGPARTPPPLPPPLKTTSQPTQPPNPQKNAASSSSSTSTSPPSSASTAASVPHATHLPPLSASSLPYPPIKSLYITAPHPFPLLETFVVDSARRYGMDLYRFGGGMKAALGEYLACGGGCGVKGVLVGTRAGDPNGDVAELAPTDPSWPAFLRIHPILHWTYADVWDFLLELDVPYCALYDQGYTSLGSTHNTVPNPLLKNEGAPTGWEPAYKLTDESKERAGRLDRSA